MNNHAKLVLEQRVRKRCGAASTFAHDAPRTKAALHASVPVGLSTALNWAAHNLALVQCSERMAIGLYHRTMVCCMCLARHNAFSGHVAPTRSYQDTAKLQMYLHFLGKA